MTEKLFEAALDIKVERPQFGGQFAVWVHDCGCP